MKENMLKRIFLPIFLVMIMGSCSGQHTTTETFAVYGNCGMCKATIEKSVKNVEGIASGVWDLPTNQMTVKYNPEIISLNAIKQKWMLNGTLKNWLQKLSHNTFLKVHQSYIVQINKIDKIEGNRLHIESYEIPVSRANKANLINALS